MYVFPYIRLVVTDIRTHYTFTLIESLNHIFRAHADLEQMRKNLNDLKILVEFAVARK